MTQVPPPFRSHDHADRGIDSEFAMEPAFQALARDAEAAGWTEDDVAAALIALATAHMKGLLADRKTRDAFSGRI